jgi:hypothetical protein
MIEFDTRAIVGAFTQDIVGLTGETAARPRVSRGGGGRGGVMVWFDAGEAQ